MDGKPGRQQSQIDRRRRSRYWANPVFVVLVMSLILGIAVSGWLGYHAYDSMFGAGSCNATLSQTWIGNGTIWTEQSVQSGPSPRIKPAMAYDPSTRQVILFGGVGPIVITGNSGTNAALTDTWAWNGRTWAQLQSATTPASTSGNVMAYDSAIQHIVLVDSQDQMTYDWTSNGWTKVAPAPVTSEYAVVAYDAALGKLELFDP